MSDSKMMVPPTAAGAKKIYWRSLDDLTQSAEYQEIAHREFPAGIEDAPDDVTRRNFLSIVAASVALAGMTSCRKPVREILPFAKRPEGFTPGIPQYYATSYVSGGYGFGTLVKSSDGRPTKVEGNPLHPSSLGGCNQHHLADLLNLYDPARSQVVRHGHPDPAEEDHEPVVEEHAEEEQGASPLDDFVSWWNSDGAAAVPGGEGLRLLLPPTTSPTQLDMLGKLAEVFPQARVHTYTPLHRDEEVAGTRLAFGRALDTHYNLEQAQVVAAFEYDFLSLDGDALKNARNWARSRKITQPGESISRLYAAESNYSVTGTMADHRFRLSSHQVGDAVFALAAALGLPGETGQALEPFADHGFQYNGKDWIAVLAADLRANQGRSCVMVGPRQPAAVQAVAHAINAFLGNTGQTVNYTPTAPSMEGSQVESIRALAADMAAGNVHTLVCLGANPVYQAPADLNFAALMENVEHTIHLGVHEDETGRACEWHIPQAHDLEAWGDIRALDGTLSMLQPLVAPLYHGVSTLELLAHLGDHPEKEGYQILRSYWQEHAQTEDFDSWWTHALHDGIVQGSAETATAVPSAPNSQLAAAVRGRDKAAAGSLANLEIVFERDPCLWDGRFSNNPWLMETPDPLTKLTWDNAALISPATAREMDVENGDVIALEADGRSLEAPVWILPGHANYSVTLNLGYGRQLDDEHKVAAGSGFDAYKLRTGDRQHMALVTWSKTGDTYQLVSTQEHGTMVGRPLARENTVAGFVADPDFAPMESPLAQAAAVQGKTEADLNTSLWPERGYDRESKDPEVRATPYQWGMVIDLNTCTGCSACVVACFSENNIATVGKQQVAVSREMIWLRTDRYFSSSDPKQMTPDEDPQVVHQPVPCQQCENAPCESVCPVMATSHSPEGLNDMAYNRCIGTRYCSNNCPYKVRRFNWFDFHGRVPEVKKMSFNPDVTVRSRGVMEKCTYCVQRINRGKATAKLEGREVRDGEITTACAQACPTEAITFGNILDLESNVARLKASPLNYAMLSERNLKPRTTYLAKIRNPNPELA